MNKIKVLSRVFTLTAFCFVICSTAFAQQSGSMNNDEVITLVKAGLSSSIIVSKIRSGKSNFDLSTDNLIKLKKAGVNDEIIGAMLEASSGTTIRQASNSDGGASRMTGADPNNPMAPHDFGIYLYEDRGGQRKMMQLTPNVSAQNRTGGGFTSAITPFGLGKVKTKANLPGTTAGVQITTPRPVFYFYLDAKSGGLNTSSGIPSTTNEFTLIRFNVRSDNREVTISKSNAYGGKGGLSDEYVVRFESESLGNGVYKVTPSTELKNGEYGFYLINSGGSNASAAVGAKFFDFGIKLTP